MGQIMNLWESFEKATKDTTSPESRKELLAVFKGWLVGNVRQPTWEKAADRFLSTLRAELAEDVGAEPEEVTEVAEKQSELPPGAPVTKTPGADIALEEVAEKFTNVERALSELSEKGWDTYSEALWNASAALSRSGVTEPYVSMVATKFGIDEDDLKWVSSIVKPSKAGFANRLADIREMVFERVPRGIGWSLDEAKFVWDMDGAWFRSLVGSDHARPDHGQYTVVFSPNAPKQQPQELVRDAANALTRMFIDAYVMKGEYEDWVYDWFLNQKDSEKVVDALNALFSPEFFGPDREVHEFSEELEKVDLEDEPKALFNWLARKKGWITKKLSNPKVQLLFQKWIMDAVDHMVQGKRIPATIPGPIAGLLNRIASTVPLDHLARLCAVARDLDLLGCSLEAEAIDNLAFKLAHPEAEVVTVEIMPEGVLVGKSYYMPEDIQVCGQSILQALMTEIGEPPRDLRHTRKATAAAISRSQTYNIPASASADPTLKFDEFSLSIGTRDVRWGQVFITTWDNVRRDVTEMLRLEARRFAGTQPKRQASIRQVRDLVDTMAQQLDRQEVTSARASVIKLRGLLG